MVQCCTVYSLYLVRKYTAADIGEVLHDGVIEWTLTLCKSCLFSSFDALIQKFIFLQKLQIHVDFCEKWNMSLPRLGCYIRSLPKAQWYWCSLTLTCSLCHKSFPIVEHKCRCSWFLNTLKLPFKMLLNADTGTVTQGQTETARQKLHVNITTLSKKLSI